MHRPEAQPIADLLATAAESMENIKISLGRYNQDNDGALVTVHEAAEKLAASSGSLLELVGKQLATQLGHDTGT